MIKRFIKVTDGLFRGSSPTPEDVVNLHKHFGIRKIVSLDQKASDRIDRITKALKIEHITIPINGKDYVAIALIANNLKQLFLENGPTFIHCAAGKDRTGMVVAMVQCKFLGMPCEEAIKEAHQIGFGIGLDPSIAKFYLHVIRNFCKEDQNAADIVDQSRPETDYRGSVLDSADMSSFAPYMDPDRIYPYNQVYDYHDNQYPTRDNWDLEELNNNLRQGNDVPAVGLFDNDPSHGFGPVEPGGGFTDF